MQTDGVHEKPASIPMRYEVECCEPIFGMPGVNKMHGSLRGRDDVFELGG